MWFYRWLRPRVLCKEPVTLSWCLMLSVAAPHICMSHVVTSHLAHHLAITFRFCSSVPFLSAGWWWCCVLFATTNTTANPCASSGMLSDRHPAVFVLLRRVWVSCSHGGYTGTAGCRCTEVALLQVVVSFFESRPLVSIALGLDDGIVGSRTMVVLEVIVGFWK